MCRFQVWSSNFLFFSNSEQWLGKHYKNVLRINVMSKIADGNLVPKPYKCQASPISRIQKNRIQTKPRLRSFIKQDGKYTQTQNNVINNTQKNLATDCCIFSQSCDFSNQLFALYGEMYFKGISFCLKKNIFLVEK